MELQGVVLVNPVELHTLDPVASHACLRDGDVVSEKEKRWMEACTVKWSEVGTVKCCVPV